MSRTNAPSTTKSGKRQVPISRPHSELAAPAHSLTTTGPEFSQPEPATVALALRMLVDAMRQHPAPDMWFLVQHSAKTNLRKRGFSQEQVAAAGADIDRLFEDSARKSPWPKDFF
jgi:hypothetical protein